MLRAGLKQWPLVAICVLVATLGTAFWVLKETKIYEAKLTLKIEPRALRPLGRDVSTPGETYSNYWADREYYATQYKILESRRIAEQVVRALTLHKDAAFLATVPASGPIPARKTWPTIEATAEVVRDKLSVSPVKKSRLVILSFEDADPKRAQKILNTVAQVYIDHTLESSMTDIGTASNWLNDQLVDLKSELEAAELALHEFKKGKQLLSVSLDDQSNMLGVEMEQLHQALTEARTRRERLASRVAQLSKASKEDPGSLNVSELLDSPALQQLRQQFLHARSELGRLRSSGKGEEHPTVLQAASQQKSARQALLQEVANIQQAAERDLAAIRQEIGGLAGLYEAAEKRAFDLNLLEIDYKRLARARGNTERLYSIVLERSKDSELSRQMRFSNVAVIDAAVLPRAPVRPRVGLTIGLGALVGFALGLGMVFAREIMDRRIRVPEDLEEGLGLTCLGTIPQIDMEAEHGAGGTIVPRARRRARQKKRDGVMPELWVHEHPSSNIAEALRTIRTNLIFMAPDEPFRKLLVTSASPTDGKTTVAASLGVTIAQSGKSVLMIDADLRRPRLSKLFDSKDPTKGVTSAIIEPESFMSCIVSTHVPNLHVLPTGSLPPNPAELLHSESFEKLLARAIQEFDRVIIDSPPLMAVTDAAILSKHADSTILVARSMSTSKEDARRALRALEDVNASLAGAVLNGVEVSEGRYGYYQYRADEDGEEKGAA